jgi:hypothetical protein
MGMEIIDAKFVVHPKKDEEAAGHAEGETEYIDQGEGFVVEQGSPGDADIVF